MQHLVDSDPSVSHQELVAALVPSRRFAHATFDTYLPGADQPTQAAAVAGLRAFSARIDEPEAKRRLFHRGAPPESRPGIYLDGGFGVGKTHLLASLFHDVTGPALFGTFVEFTHLVGALGFSATVERLSRVRLVCIDEFELDDPGDTVLISSLLRRLAEAGVRLAATSNTLPDRLGEGRFAAEDFLREIQGLNAHFDIYRIDGPDYRHRGLPAAPAPATDQEVRDAAEVSGGTLDGFEELLVYLATIHPSRYGRLVEGVPAVHLLGVRPVADQAVALRLVVLADRLYDRDVPVQVSGTSLDRLFTPELLRGGYRKKYFRAISRLVALARDGAGNSEFGPPARKADGGTARGRASAG